MTCSCPKGWCYQRRDCRRVEPAAVAAELIHDAAVLPAPVLARVLHFTGKLGQRAQAEAAALPPLCNTRLIQLRERQVALTEELSEAGSFGKRRRRALEDARRYVEQAIVNLEKA